MEVFVAEKFMDRLDQLFEKKKEDVFSDQYNGLLSVFRLLNSLPLNSDILLSNDEVESVIKNKGGKTCKEKILFSAVKNNLYKYGFSSKELYSKLNYSAYYFTDETSFGKELISAGIIGRGIDFDGDYFFEKCTVADLHIKEGFTQIENVVTPASSMVIIDPYLFNEPFEKKLQNLIDFIKIYKGELKIDFHLTLLCTNEKKHGQKVSPLQIEKAFTSLIDLKAIEVQIFVENKKLPHDRMILSNYSTCNIGVPFMGVETRYNQLFLGNGNSIDSIRLNYKIYKAELEKWYKLIMSIPKVIGLQKYIWASSDFTNRIFEPILK